MLGPEAGWGDIRSLTGKAQEPSNINELTDSMAADRTHCGTAAGSPARSKPPSRVGNRSRRVAPPAQTPIIMAHHTLDARFLLCPLPVLRTQAKIRDLLPGDVLEVQCTDHGVLADIPAWCRINGHRHIDSYERDGVVTILLEVGGDAG
jgi:tRNA 2-thiouridine synthesizing protein A